MTSLRIECEEGRTRVWVDGEERHDLTLVEFRQEVGGIPALTLRQHVLERDEQGVRAPRLAAGDD